MRKHCHRHDCDGKEFKLQWGRTLSSAETPAQQPETSRIRDPLQWGRTLSSAETEKRASMAAVLTVASMGPHSFKCGNSPHRRDGLRNNSGFNGAALFQVRKLVDSVLRRQLFRASMGPHSFKCGNSFKLTNPAAECVRFNGAALFQVRKRPLCQCEIDHTGQLQWGRTLSSAETNSSPDNRVTSFLLQWGRTLSSAETQIRILKEFVEVSASMGPHSFKCGNTTIRRRRVEAPRPLQWGRTLSSAETLDRPRVLFW